MAWVVIANTHEVESQLEPVVAVALSVQAASLAVDFGRVPFGAEGLGQESEKKVLSPGH